MRDTHTHKLEESNKTYVGLRIDPDKKTSEGLKSSNLNNIVVEDFVVHGGREDCFDAVRGKNITLIDGVLEAIPDYTRTHITMKGSITNYILKNIVLKNKPRAFWNIALGDHTIYDNEDLKRPLMKNGLIDNVRREDGKKVTIVCMLAEKPEVKNGNYRVIKIPTFIVRIYFWGIKMVTKLVNSKVYKKFQGVVDKVNYYISKLY